MRILHTESSLGWGGQENRTLNEMIGLRTLGHEMSLACQPGAKLGARARDAGFTVHETPMRNALDLPAIWRLHRFMGLTRAEIINCHSGRDTQLAGMAARLIPRRPRIIRTRHLALPITSRFTYSVLPDHVVTVSRYVQRYLVSAGIPERQLTTVATGIDLDRYARPDSSSDLRVELGIPPDTLIVGTIAILRGKKGHQQILDSAPAVLAQFPQTHFVFAGDGPQFDKIQSRIAALNLEHHVHMLGLRSDVSNLLASFDIFLLPTHQEALGTAFIEAGAMGLPSVGTNVDGVPEVVRDGETGILVPPQDGAALIEPLCRLLADAELRRRMGTAASRLVRQYFSVASMAIGMESVYRRLLLQR